MIIGGYNYTNRYFMYRILTANFCELSGVGNKASGIETCVR